MRRRQWGVAVVALLIGLGIVGIVRGQDTEEFLASAREPDLVRLLDDLQARQTRLDGEILRLQAAEQRLRTGTSAEALQEAQQRADDLRVLAGTTPVQGPGVRLRVDGQDAFFASDLLNTVQELRDAGAEAIEVNNQRVVVNTWFADETAGISVSGVVVGSPYTIVAIGGPTTMATAMSIPGGVVDTVESQDGSVVITELETVTIASTVNLPALDPQVSVTD
ncbi:MAG: DUF881 domain-containing protein [Candidatus Nanopelagicales bacterium]